MCLDAKWTKCRQNWTECLWSGSTSTEHQDTSQILAVQDRISQVGTTTAKSFLGLIVSKILVGPVGGAGSTHHNSWTQTPKLYRLWPPSLTCVGVLWPWHCDWNWGSTPKWRTSCRRWRSAMTAWPSTCHRPPWPQNRWVRALSISTHAPQVNSYTRLHK